ncbi:zinc ribbon domain-containing protein [Mycobacterium spongiae]|uniref:Cas12f1-like TNB domain-containing protein n=1 Tax=Mycobacterium spongiae TaxID=886343 RepID=A0A975PYD0_9MYCO|nr:hypothetical protein [Mycobacterium spongiae]QUR68744.1 hypothetical protein F6B93_18180 [Mycobacterium spongiae]
MAKGWHQFTLALESSARSSGTTVVKAPAAFTSQRCLLTGLTDETPHDLPDFSAADGSRRWHGAIA